MRILLNKEAPISRTGASERSVYVLRSVRITVSVTKVTITIAVGDETLVIEIPII